MKIYAVIDTNVIVSALLSHYDDAATVRIIRKIIVGDIVPVFNDDILNEYSAVLHRAKFDFPEAVITQTLRTFIKFGVNAERLVSNTQLPDPKDLVFYEVALSSEDSYLVTGNIKHFPKEPFIVTPAEMIHIIESLENPSILNEPRTPYGEKW